MGSNLALGRVVDGELRCPLHHWRFDGTGACTASPGLTPTSLRRASAFPVIEKYSLVFVYSGRESPPPFPAMPDGDIEAEFRTVALPSARLACHYQLATANGLDAIHFDALHNVEPLSKSRYEVDEASYSVHVSLHGRHRGWLLRLLSGGDIRARYSAVGPSLAWLTFLEPFRWHVLFATRPTVDGNSESTAILFVPRGRTIRTIGSILFLLWLLRQDSQVMKALPKNFQSTFVDSDAPMAAYASLMERWPRS